jgi:WD40 repeat protein
MPRGLALALLVTLAAPVLAADSAPLLLAPPDTKLPEGAKFRVGRPTDSATTVLAFSADGKTLAAITNRGYTGGIDAPVELWNVETGAHVASLRYHNTGVMAAAFAPDGSVIATSGIDNRLRFWDGKTGKDITKDEHINLTGHGYNLTFSPDGKRLLVGSTKLELYDVEKQKPVKKDYFAETAQNMFFHTATWSPKGKYIVAACDGPGVRVWDAATGNLLYKLDVKYFVHRTRFAFSSDDKLLLVSTWPEGQFKLFDAETGKEQSAVKPPAGEVSSEHVQFARMMGRVAWIVQKQQYQPGGSVVVSDATGQELKRFDLPGTSFSIRLSDDGVRVAVGGTDGSLRIYEAETGKLQHTVLGAWSAVFRSVYANGGKVLRTVHPNGTVHDFDADTGKHLKERTLPLKGELPVAVSADGKFFATATEAGAFTIWNLDTGEASAKPKATLFVYREPGAGGPGPFPLPPGPVPLPPQPAPPKDDADAAPPAAAPPALPPPPPPGGGRLPPPPPWNPQPGPPQFFASFSADSKLFVAVTGKDESAVTCFDVTTGEEKHTVKTPKGVTAVALSADGTHLYTGHGRPGAEAGPQPPGGDDKKDAGPIAVRRFELKTGKEVQSWKAAAGEKKPNVQFARSEVAALYPLADKETLIVVEAQVFNLWPPPPGRPGFAQPGQRHALVRVINLAGREKDRTIDAGAAPLTVAPDGKSIGFVVTEMSDPNKPATVVKVIDATTGAAKAATVATGYQHNFGDQNRGVTFRPGGTDLAVRTGDGTVLVVDAGKLKEVKDAKPEGKKE